MKAYYKDGIIFVKLEDSSIYRKKITIKKDYYYVYVGIIDKNDLPDEIKHWWVKPASRRFLNNIS
jgi:hypothetical protein